MSWDDDDPKTVYQVVLNDEEQYSIWPSGREIPLGWREAGKSGTKPECLAYIEQVWTDMRPLSLRKRMSELQPEPPPPEPSLLPPDDLIDLLSQAGHAVVIRLRGEDRVKRLREAIDGGYVLITFVNTKGGTELGVPLDEERTDLTRADFGNATGIVRLAGTLRLNGTPVRCVADVAIETLEGSGHLERI